jgi:hypothetical protein
MASQKQVYNAEEVRSHKDAKSTWITIHNKVYDVTKFLDEVSILATSLVKISASCGRRQILGLS